MISLNNYNPVRDEEWKKVMFHKVSMKSYYVSGFLEIVLDLGSQKRESVHSQAMNMDLYLVMVGIVNKLFGGILPSQGFPSKLLPLPRLASVHNPPQPRVDHHCLRLNWPYHRSID